MKRSSMFGSALLLVALCATGCGQKTTTGVPYALVSQQGTSSAAKTSQAYTTTKTVVAASAKPAPASPKPSATPTPAPGASASGDTATAGDTVDNSGASASPDPSASVDPVASPTPTPSPSASASAAPTVKGSLGIQVTGKQIIRKLLILKRLQISLHVSNSGTRPLSGMVKVDFYATTGIFSKTTKVVETQTQEVTDVPPGGVDVTLTSSKSSDNAEAFISTVSSIQSASTSN